MKNITLRYLFLAVLVMLIQSCAEDDSSLTDGLPDSIINTDPEGAPPRALTENWSGHDEQLLRQSFTNPVAVYYDAEVDRNITWPFNFYTSAWGYATRTYGSFGPNNYLHIVGHGEEKSTFIRTYLDTLSGSRNIIDFPILNNEITPESVDTSIYLMGELVENANNSVEGSPAAAIWKNKFQELFMYDFYLSNEMQADAERVKAKFLESSVDFPKPDTFWFRDWFLPLYENYEGATTMRKFFNLVAANYPINGISYQGDMTLGEMVHFFSGATGDDLEAMAIEAFDFDDQNKQELLVARGKYPTLNYPFVPASELIDVTSEGMATIEVSKDNNQGANAGEGSLKLIDNDINSKFLTGGFPQEFYMQQNFQFPVVVNKYSFTSGNDAPGRDPKDWKLQGSLDGVEFDDLHTITGATFSTRKFTKEFSFENSKAYRHYRIVILANNGEGNIQLSEWRLLNLKIITFGPQDITATSNLTVSRDNTAGANGAEGSNKAIDNNVNTKFLVGGFPQPVWMQQNFQNAVKVTAYSITSANDAHDRDPLSWTLSGSNNGTVWTELDARTNEDFDSYFKKRTFQVDNEQTFTSYRLEITENNGSDAMQLAEWRVLAE